MENLWMCQAFSFPFQVVSAGCASLFTHYWSQAWNQSAKAPDSQKTSVKSNCPLPPFPLFAFLLSISASGLLFTKAQGLSWACFRYPSLSFAELRLIAWCTKRHLLCTVPQFWSLRFPGPSWQQIAHVQQTSLCSLGWKMFYCYIILW